METCPAIYAAYCLYIATLSLIAQFLFTIQLQHKSACRICIKIERAWINIYRLLNSDLHWLNSALSHIFWYAYKSDNIAKVDDNTHNNEAIFRAGGKHFAIVRKTNVKHLMGMYVGQFIRKYHRNIVRESSIFSIPRFGTCKLSKLNFRLCVIREFSEI